MQMLRACGGVQRNGPAACYNLLSALERRRQEQEDAGLNPVPMGKSLYKVTTIKRILASIVNECRAAKSEIPGKNSTISWDQVWPSCCFAISCYPAAAIFLLLPAAAVIAAACCCCLLLLPAAAHAALLLFANL